MSSFLSRFGLGRAPEPLQLKQAAGPSLNGAEIAVAYFSDIAGGDCYEFIRVSPQRLLFGLMDFAGKRQDIEGICSATQKVFCNSGMELLAPEDINESVAMVELAHRMNAAIMRSAGGVCSSSMFLGCYNEEIGTVCYVNAGHTPGLLRDEQSIVELPATGLPLGLFSLAPVDACTVGLGRRSAMAIPSRGVVEASRKGDEFGLAGVRDALERHPGPAQKLSLHILESVQDFVRDIPRHNDVTALAITRGGLPN